jgi:hypothetical protein
MTNECYEDNYGGRVKDKRKIKVINSKENLMRISKGIVDKSGKETRENVNTKEGGDD